MKVILTKVLALGALCALFVGASNATFAQGYDRYNQYDHQYGHRYDHRDMGGDRHLIGFDLRDRLQQLQREYAHDVHVGNYEAARRAHFRAQQIRARLHGNRDFHDFRG